MSAIKNAAARISRAGPLPTPSSGKLLHCEKAASRMASGNRGSDHGGIGSEDWEAVAARLDFADLGSGRPNDLRRAMDAIWDDEPRADRAADLIAYGLAAERKTYDRALILAYLRHFPLDHPAFPMLLDGAETAAERHDWEWRERGRRFQLWDEENGPAGVGAALVGTDDPLSVLREAGLGGEVSEGKFVAEALDDACETVGQSAVDEAEILGRRLINLFDGLGVGSADAMLVYALLNPWSTKDPSEDYRKVIGSLLAKRIGDPRFSTGAWAGILADISDWFPQSDPAGLLEILRRWLTQATVRGFFTIVGRTTDRQDQWAARESFWLAYLDAGLISEAWFAFGRRAELLAGALAKQENIRFARVVGGADPSHSSLIMTIGDIRIAEWSHNGSCRLWPKDSKSAPPLYLAEYDGNRLRTTASGAGFAYIPHGSGWEAKIASRIYRQTGLKHPVHGAGGY